MKIAVPTRQGFVDDHINFCETYTIYTVDENLVITGREEFEPVEGCCCRTNAAVLLRQKGVSVILAGDVQVSALNRMAGQGLEIIRYCHGEADHVVHDYLGKLMKGSCEYCRKNEQWDHRNN